MNPAQGRTLMDVLLAPQSVALIGASNDANKVTGRPLAFLQANHSTARIFPVNPHRDEVQGIAAAPSILAIDTAVEQAYILLNSDAAVEAVAECAQAGVRVATVLADGFAEAGPQGRARQARLLDISQQTGMRIVGPNSMGVVELHNGFVCTTNAAFAASTLTPGRYGVLSQSGSIIGTLLSRGHATGVHFSFFVSLGNEADLGLGEMGQALVDHDQTDAFILFMETIRRPDDIAAFAKAAQARGKPVVVYKLGRSSLADALAVSHTGAIIGSDAAADCFFRQHGIARVNLFDTLFELPGLLCTASHALRQRPKTATVVTTTGGGGAMVVDCLGVLGVEVAAPSQQCRTILAAHGIRLTGSPLVDVTLAGANYETMTAVLKALISDPSSGVIIVAVGSSAQFLPQLAVHPIIDAVKAIGPAGAPVVGFAVPNALEALQLLAYEGIASARTVESCAEMVALYLRQVVPMTRKDPVEGEKLTLDLDLGDHTEIVLNEVECGHLLETLGIGRPQELLVGITEKLPPTINLNFPVVAKLVCRDMPHKTQAGVVTLNLPDRNALATAINAMLMRVRQQRPEVTIDGVLIQEQIDGLAEVMLGVTRDVAVGATITVASGGTLAEIYQDFAIRLAPVDIDTARAMIEEVKSLAIIRGYRNLPKGDIDALAKTIVRFSRIVLDERIQEAEINPLIVGAENEGCVAVDGLIRLGKRRPDS